VVAEFFDATNEDMMIRPPTPPSTESQPTTEVDLPGAVIGPDNWKFRVQVRVDNSIPGVSLVFRSICRWEDNFTVNVILTRIVDGQVVQGKVYKGDFGVHYYGDNMPNEFLEAFLQGVKDAEEEERLEAMQAGGAAGSVLVLQLVLLSQLVHQCRSVSLFLVLQVCQFQLVQHKKLNCHQHTCLCSVSAPVSATTTTATTTTATTTPQQVY
jgi:hypothetical protein